MAQSSAVEPATADQAGPIDYLIISFASGHADAGALDTLRRLAREDLIRVLDLEFVARAADGTVTLVEPGDAIAAADGDLSDFLGASSGLLDADDVRHVGEIIEPGSLAAIVVYENEWILALAGDLRRARASVLALGTVPLHELDAALDRA
jgi:uncharacterized membrane protein